MKTRSEFYEPWYWETLWAVTHKSIDLLRDQSGLYGITLVNN